MSGKNSATLNLTDLEDDWKVLRSSWTKALWRRAAEMLDEEVGRLATELTQKTRKRRRGRPPKPKFENWLMDSYWEARGGWPKKPPGRPKKYGIEYWENIYKSVEFECDKIQSETGKRPTIKAAIESIASDWARDTRRSKSEQRKEVKRWQRQYSRAKTKIAK